MDSVVGRLKAAAPGVPIGDAQVLTDYDSYYYSRGRQAPLPVLRVRFNDPMRTWIYVDPEMSQIVAQVHRLNRLERWLYNGLHSLDFSFWYGRRPLWDIGMILLLLGGLTSSTIGFCLGIKRIRRRAAKAVAPAVATIPAAWLLLIVTASNTSAKPATIDIRVTGTHQIAASETLDAARELALVDAERKTLLKLLSVLQNRTDVKGLGLTTNQLEAYVAAVLNVSEASSPTSCVESTTVCRVTVSVHMDADETVQRVGRIRKDQESSWLLEKIWRQIRNVDTPPQALEVKRLAMQAAVALAHTEDAPIGGRAPTKEGRTRARQLADAALALAPDSADAHVMMGDVLVDAQELDAAATEYRKALEMNPDSSWNHARLGNALLLDGSLGEAQSELREALGLDASSAQAHADLGLVLRSQRQFPEAVAEFREALRLSPDFIEAHNGLAVTLARLGKMADAVAEFREIVRVDPDSAIGYYNLSYALADMDRDQESAEALREVIRINPNHYNARYNMGELFRLEGKYDESVTQFKEYLRLAPDTPPNRRNIGRAKNFIKTFENE
jgi:tetratricopeptide (TPR) repeat protein